MTDDKSLVDAYASIYNKKEKEKEQLDEALPAIIGMGAKFLARKAAGAVGNMAKNAIGGVVKRGVGMLNPKKQEAQTEQLANAYASIYKESVGSAIDKSLSAAKDTAEVADKAVDGGSKVLKKVSKRVGQVATTPIGMFKSAVKGAKKGAQAEEVTHEDVAITHLDGSTTEVIDVVTPPPLGNKEEDQEALHNRLWDQVTANLTTLGEMDDTRYQVAPLEEKKKLDPVGEEDDDVDNDGDVDDSDSYIKNKRKKIAMAMGKKNGKKKDEDMKEEVVAEGGDGDPCWDSHKMVGMKKKGGKMVPNCVKKESFNVKSPVIFSKPEEKTEEPVISEEMIEKHASAISKAHKSIQG